MKKVYLILPILAILFASCGDVTEEYWIEKDGSGKMEMRVDIGGMIDQLGSLMGEEEAPALGSEDIIMDTMINFYDAAPDSILESMENPELLKKVNITMSMNTPKKKALMTMGIDFASTDELSKIMSEVDRVKQKQAGANPMGGMRGMGGISGMMQGMGGVGSKPLHWERGKFIRPGVSPEEMKEQMENEELDLSDPQSQMFLEMMFGKANYTTIVHLPKKVCKVSPKDRVEKEKYVVTYSQPLVEMMTKGFPDLEIKYKK